jgi:hypothetical protein
VKLLFYVAGGYVVMAVAALVITQGQAPESHPVMLFALVALFGIPPLGAAAPQQRKDPYISAGQVQSYSAAEVSLPRDLFAGTGERDGLGRTSSVVAHTHRSCQRPRRGRFKDN